MCSPNERWIEAAQPQELSDKAAARQGPSLFERAQCSLHRANALLRADRILKKGWQGTRKTGGSGEKGPSRSFLAHFERISWWHRCLTLRISWYWHEATHKQRKAHPKVSKWSHTIKIGYAERWILSILRAPPCRKFDADGKGVGCVIDYMTISEDTDI